MMLARDDRPLQADLVRFRWAFPVAKSPQTSCICERFHKTMLNEFYRVAFRKKVYRSIDELQADIKEYNGARPPPGRLVLWKDPDADLPGCNADGKGENGRSLIASDTKTGTKG
jgi:hypothetical protein